MNWIVILEHCNVTLIKKIIFGIQRRLVTIQTMSKKQNNWVENKCEKKNTQTQVTYIQNEKWEAWERSSLIIHIDRACVYLDVFFSLMVNIADE